MIGKETVISPEKVDGSAGPISVTIEERHYVLREARFPVQMRSVPNFGTIASQKIGWAWFNEQTGYRFSPVFEDQEAARKWHERL